MAEPELTIEQLRHVLTLADEIDDVSPDEDAAREALRSVLANRESRAGGS